MQGGNFVFKLTMGNEKGSCCLPKENKLVAILVITGMKGEGIVVVLLDGGSKTTS